MHLWRSLPEGQLLAVLRWMSARRGPAAAADKPAAPKTGTAADKVPVPLR